MIGQPTQSLELRYHRLETFNRWLLALAVVALVAFGGLGIWTLLNRAAPADGDAIVTDWLAAWGGDDPAALASVYADDAVLIDYAGQEYSGVASIENLFSVMRADGFSAERIGPFVQEDTTIAVPMHLSWSTGGELWVTAVLTMDEDGLITRHQDYGGPAE